MRKFLLSLIAVSGLVAASAASAQGAPPRAPHGMGAQLPVGVGGAPALVRRPPVFHHRQHMRHARHAGFAQGPWLYPAYPAAVDSEPFEAPRMATREPALEGAVYGITHIQGRLAQGDHGYVAQPVLIEVSPRGRTGKISEIRSAPFSVSRVTR